jgi:integrase
MMQSLARWKYGLATEPYQVDSGPRLRRQHCAAALDVGEPPHGAVYHDRGLLFCWSDGRPIYPETITDHFNRLVDRAGLPLITPHDVRHTYATMSQMSGIASDASFDEISERILPATSSIRIDHGLG